MAEFTGILQPLGRAWRKAADRAVASYGLSEATAFPVFHIVRLGEGVRQNTLAEALGIEGASLVRLLDVLCAAGLLERREDPADRRARTLHLTGEGRKLAARAGAALDELRREIFKEVSPEDLEASLRVFHSLGKALSER